MADVSADGSHLGEQLDAIQLVQQLAPSVSRSQLETVLYPDNGLRKAELIAYYTTIADWMES